MPVREESEEGGLLCQGVLNRRGAIPIAPVTIPIAPVAIPIMPVGVRFLSHP